MSEELVVGCVLVHRERGREERGRERKEDEMGWVWEVWGKRAGKAEGARRTKRAHAGEREEGGSRRVSNTTSSTTSKTLRCKVSFQRGFGVGLAAAVIRRMIPMRASHLSIVPFSSVKRESSSSSSSPHLPLLADPADDCRVSNCTGVPGVLGVLGAGVLGVAGDLGEELLLLSIPPRRRFGSPTPRAAMHTTSTSPMAPCDIWQLA